MKAVQTQVSQGDCLDVLSQDVANDAIDLIFTSPPYADRRMRTYGSVNPDKYVEWFLPRAEQLLRVLKPTGLFVLNIKEKVENGERHTYVLGLILALRRQGWHWIEEYIWHKKTVTQASDQIAFVVQGSAACTLRNRAGESRNRYGTHRKLGHFAPENTGS